MYPGNLLELQFDSPVEDSVEESAEAKARAEYVRRQEVYEPWFDWDIWIEARLAEVERRLALPTETVFIDLDQDSHRQVVVDREAGQ